MTLKEAIFKSLEDIGEIANHLAVYNKIVEKNYYDFGKGLTPESSVSADLGDLIRNEDTRIKRIKRNNGTYWYYLTKNEDKINIDDLTGMPGISTPVIKKTETAKTEKKKTYEERDLHKLLSSYLKNTSIFSKTIFHEQSNGKDSNQIWTHPDMVGIKFLNLQSKASQNFLKSINRIDAFKLNSY